MEDFKGTKGEWMLPHLASGKTDCNCGFVLNEGYCGAIATIHWSKDRSVENGDNPPLDEAIANAKLIAAAPELLEALQYLLSSLNSYDENDRDAINQAKAAINKALGH